MDRIFPIRDIIAIRPVPVKTRTTYLILPPEAQKTVNWGIISLFGPLVKNTRLAIGDRVLYSTALTVLEIDGVRTVMATLADLMAIKVFCDIIPLGDRYIIYPEFPPKVHNGIVTPEKFGSPPTRGTILRTSFELEDNSSAIQPGTRVMYSSYAATALKDGEVTHHIVRAHDIISIL